MADALIPDEKPPSDPAKTDMETREALLVELAKVDLQADVGTLSADQIEYLKLAKEVATWTPGEKDHFEEKGWREPRAGEIPAVKALVRPTDYDNDLKRGTVTYHDGLWNYSFHTVHIPDGTIVQERNFAQLEPNTIGIVGQNLTFIDCNLVNVAIDPSWTVQGCNTAQAWLVDENGVQKRQWICAHPSELKGNEIPPENIITARDF